MILVIGGSCQGKRQICRQLAGIEENLYRERLADGKTDTPETALQRPYAAAYHLFLRQVLERGENPEDYTKKVIAASPEIISMDEVGCGIVPVDRKEREYREAAGRCGQLLAAEAKEVYRVICGISQQIKPGAEME